MESGVMTQKINTQTAFLADQIRQKLEASYNQENLDPKLSASDRIKKMIADRIAKKNLPTIALPDQLHRINLPLEGRLVSLKNENIKLLDVTVGENIKDRGAFMMAKSTAGEMQVKRGDGVVVFKEGDFCCLQSGDQVLDKDGKTVFVFTPQPNTFESKDIVSDLDFVADPNLPKNCEITAISCDVGGFKKLIYGLAKDQPDLMFFVMREVIKTIKNSIKPIDGLSFDVFLSGDGCKFAFGGQNISKQQTLEIYAQVQSAINTLLTSENIKILEGKIKKIIPDFEGLNIRFGVDQKPAVSTKIQENLNIMTDADIAQGCGKDIEGTGLIYMLATPEFANKADIVGETHIAKAVSGIEKTNSDPVQVVLVKGDSRVRTGLEELYRKTPDNTPMPELQRNDLRGRLFG